jgi:hypothetical protein
MLVRHRNHCAIRAWPPLVGVFSAPACCSERCARGEMVLGSALSEGASVVALHGPCFGGSVSRRTSASRRNSVRRLQLLTPQTHQGSSTSRDNRYHSRSMRSCRRQRHSSTNDARSVLDGALHCTSYQRIQPHPQQQQCQRPRNTRDQCGATSPRISPFLFARNHTTS